MLARLWKMLQLNLKNDANLIDMSNLELGQQIPQNRVVATKSGQDVPKSTTDDSKGYAGTGHCESNISVKNTTAATISVPEALEQISPAAGVQGFNSQQGDDGSKQPSESTGIMDSESNEVRRFELLRSELMELEKRVQRSAD
ncbi:hypothetical protein K7X08_035682 [Anisodus acutangulus]|uniref:Uncharacterized protein n=1 Tax=Anisodus acutangulus TaxID=402998 RepID=A0A9Q1M9X3_9SOLA|nr:hypothetical protein K7X08_035682 [Anisodus acutangulus]